MTNRKTTKRALFTSTLALLMCVAMLIGTTFAWFTDTASTSVNKVQAGKLDVALEMLDGTNWVSAEGKTLNFVKAGGADDEAILWEPGCAYKLPAIKIVNNGNLALKYNVQFSAVSGDLELAKVLDVYVSGLSTDSDEGDCVGTLYTMLTSTDNDGFAHGNLVAGAESNALTVVVKMQETAGNDYQEKVINGIAVTVHATQDTVEYDSFGNQYDKDAPLPVFWDGVTTTVPTADADGVYHITNAAEFVYFMKHANVGGADYVLDCDIDLGGAKFAAAATDTGIYHANFDGKGHTVSNFTVDSSARSDGYYGGLFGYITGAGSIKNLTVKDATIIGGNQVGAIIGGMNGGTVEDCHAINCTIIGAKKVGAVVGYTANGYVTNCSATNCNVYCADADINQAGKVVGFINTVNDGCVDNTSGLTDNNVNVYTGVTPTVVSSAAELRTALDTASTIVLASDINMDSWTVIEAANRDLTIEGNGHALKNLSVPLFKKVDNNNYTFKNVTVDNANIDAAADTVHKGYGAFIGEINNNGGGTVNFENCTVKNSSIKAYKYAGAFVGFASNVAGTVDFTDCKVIDTTVNTADSSCGGFIGHTYSTTNLTNCAVSGDTNVGCNESGSSKAGWFVGTVNGERTTFTDCTANSVGSLVSSAPLADGFVGRTAETGTWSVN